LWEDKRTEGRMHGFTDNYIRVETEFDKSLVNTLTKVRLGDFTEDGMSLSCSAL